MVRFVGFLGILVGCFTSTSGAQARPEVEGGQPAKAESLEPGWNLVVAQSDRARLPPAWAEREWVVWSVGASYRPEPARSLVAGTRYWVHVPARQVSAFLGVARAPSPVSRPSGWQIFSVASPTIYADPRLDRVLVWEPSGQVYRPVQKGALLQSGEEYWGHFLEEGVSGSHACRTTEVGGEAVVDGAAPCAMGGFSGGDLPAEEQVRAWTPRPPTDISAVPQGHKVALQWRSPAIFVTGHEISAETEVTHRVYRDGVLLQEGLDRARFEDEVPTRGQIYDYTVTAVVRDREGTPFESSRPASLAVEVRLSSSPQAGLFEGAGVVAEPNGSAALPSAALSSMGGEVMGHVVYVVRDPKRGDTLWYTRSLKAGKPGSFEPGLAVDSGQPGWTASEVAVAARGGGASALLGLRPRLPAGRGAAECG